MLLKPLQPEIIELTNKLAAADIVKVDDDNFVITKKSKMLGSNKIIFDKIEDHEMMFQTDYHIFNWWEISHDSTKLNDREWKVGEFVMSFYTLQPC